MSKSYVAKCEMCDHQYSIGRLCRARYEPLDGHGPLLDQGILCTRCWRDFPLTVDVNGSVWQLVSRSY